MPPSFFHLTCIYRPDGDIFDYYFIFLCHIFFVYKVTIIIWNHLRSSPYLYFSRRKTHIVTSWNAINYIGAQWFQTLLCPQFATTSSGLSQFVISSLDWSQFATGSSRWSQFAISISLLPYSQTSFPFFFYYYLIVS